MVNFKENYHFSRFQRGSNIFQGGPTFSRGGGGPIAYSLETHITCVPPLDPPLYLTRQCVSAVLSGPHMQL